MISLKRLSGLFAIPLVALGANASTQCPATCPPEELVTTESLQQHIDMNQLLEYVTDWQGFANETECNCRYTGTEAHNKTLEYIAERVECTGYYDVERQYFSYLQPTFSRQILRVDDVEYSSINVFENSKDGNFSGTELVWINSFGCNSSSEWPANAAGKIGLISRGPIDGSCLFDTKSANAGAAGLQALIVYDFPDDGDGLLGLLSPENNATIPTMGLSSADGLELVEKLQARNQTKVLVDEFYVATDYDTIYTYNVIASSKLGDPQNALVLGAHTDSPASGPGINDSGSGSAALLHIALTLAPYRLAHQVRFAWWTANTQGALGSTQYIARALARATTPSIRLYLDAAALASPNGIVGVRDSDGLAFGDAGPPGSGAAKTLLRTFLARQPPVNVTAPWPGPPLNSSTPTNPPPQPVADMAFGPRNADYAPFAQRGQIPAAGLFAGSDEVKDDAEAAAWGGMAGAVYDPNAGGPRDTVQNLSVPLWRVHVRALAHVVASYAVSWSGIPRRSAGAGTGVGAPAGDVVALGDGSLW